MKRYLFLAALAATALVSCEKAENVEQPKGDENRPVQFTVSNFYSVTTKADPIADGKHVAIYAGAPISKDNVQMTVAMEAADAGTLAPTVTNSLLWAVGQTTQETRFLGVYPYANGRTLVGDTEAEKYIDYNISSDDDVEYAEVFLAAAASQAPGTDTANPEKVALAFKHPFAKLVYNIDNQSDDYVKSVSIKGIRRTGHLMFTTGAVVPTGEAITEAVALLANGENSYKTVVMPEATAVNPIILIEMYSGAKYTFQLASAIALEAGKIYTAGITLTGSHGTEASDRTVTGTFTVTDWDNVDAGDLASGDVTPATKWWYLEGNIDELPGTSDGNWSKHIPFACVGPNTWKVDFYYAGTTDASTGLKIRYAADMADWSEAWGKELVIDAANIAAVDAEDTYLATGLSKEGSPNIRINAVGNYRIKFYSDTHDFHIYKLD